MQAPVTRHPPPAPRRPGLLQPSLIRPGRPLQSRSAATSAAKKGLRARANHNATRAPASLPPHFFTRKMLSLLSLARMSAALPRAVQRAASTKAAPASAAVAAAAPAKRPLNAYMRFAAAKRAEVKAAAPAAGVTEQAKVIGALWRALSAAEKELWKTR